MTDNYLSMIGLPCIGIYVLLFAILITKQKSLKHNKLIYILSLALVVTMSSLVVSLTIFDSLPSSPIRVFFGIMNAPNLIVFWLFVRVMFEDGLSIGKFEYGIGICYTALMVWERLSENQIISLPLLIQLGIGICSISLIIHLIWGLLKGRKNDLVESRRYGRILLVAGLVLAALISVIAHNSELFFVESVGPFLSVLCISVATLTIAAYVLRLDFSQIITPPKPLVHRNSRLTGREKENYDKLMDYMARERAYLDASLSIVKLAKSLGLGEHTLRALINKNLGYRNYTDFINQYRIGYAKTIFSDPDKKHIPILTIAFDSGYNSISAFNRAFRRLETITPSEYRALKNNG